VTEQLHPTQHEQINVEMNLAKTEPDLWQHLARQPSVSGGLGNAVNGTEGTDQQAASLLELHQAALALEAHPSAASQESQRRLAQVRHWAWFPTHQMKNC